MQKTLLLFMNLFLVLWSPSSLFASCQDQVGGKRTVCEADRVCKCQAGDRAGEGTIVYPDFFGICPPDCPSDPEPVGADRCEFARQLSFRSTMPCSTQDTGNLGTRCESSGLLPGTVDEKTEKNCCTVEGAGRSCDEVKNRVRYEKIEPELENFELQLN